MRTAFYAVLNDIIGLFVTKLGSSHGINALCVQGMFDPKVGLRKLLALAVRVYRFDLSAQLFLLLTHANMTPDLNRDKVLKLLVQALDFLARCGVS